MSGGAGDKANGRTLTENEIFSVIGESGVRRMVAGFYRQIPADDVLGPMYPPHDLPGR